MFAATELFGYTASFFVAISLLMSSFIWLRVLNLVGAISFVIYGSLLGSIPIVITNGFITIINVYFLIQMFRPDLNGVQYVPIGADRRDRLDDFVTYYQDDIVHFFPDFSADSIDECFAAGGTAYLALKDVRLVGFALVHPLPSSPGTAAGARDEVYSYIRQELYPEKSVLVPVDYIIRKYRGLGFAHRLYQTIEREESASFLLAPVCGTARKHRRFLLHHGFHLERELTTYDVYAKATPTEDQGCD
ncbi:MAG: hypothetical protein PF508_14080 [Spirochaeta sp.]|jgi:GNAT superfamily N-acetyltransferase|nr:hypothetical protein [Spirochaeta sp.]